MDFINACLRTESPVTKELEERVVNNIRAIHAIMGLETEVGELMDQFKKHVFYGKPLDIVNVKEELGDLMWYMSLLLDCCNGTYEECQTKVIDKLTARYPEKFTEDKALNRNLDLERTILECGNN